MVLNGLMGVSRQISLSREFLHSSMFQTMLCVKRTFMLLRSYTNLTTPASTHYTGKRKSKVTHTREDLSHFITMTHILQNFFDDRFQYFMNDAGHRLATLGSLGLMPRFFGNDLSKMFKQRYYGDLTL